MLLVLFGTSSILWLSDMGFRGPMFTWNNRKDGVFNIQERFDPSLASIQCCALYPNAYVEHLEDKCSNHRPLLIHVAPSIPKAKRLFCFDARWVSNPTMDQIISQAWRENVNESVIFKVHSKLKACRRALMEWNKSNSSNSKKRIVQLELDLARPKETLPWNLERVKSIKKDLMGEIRNEEKYWEQKAGLNWLKSRDKNTFYFHARVIQ